jgi:hypothetical protein
VLVAPDDRRSIVIGAVQADRRGRAGEAHHAPATATEVEHVPERAECDAVRGQHVDDGLGGVPATAEEPLGIAAYDPSAPAQVAAAGHPGNVGARRCLAHVQRM